MLRMHLAIVHILHHSATSVIAGREASGDAALKAKTTMPMVSTTAAARRYCWVRTVLLWPASHVACISLAWRRSCGSATATSPRNAFVYDNSCTASGFVRFARS